VWSHRGWKTSLTSASHDRGIDVIATWNGVISRKEAIQVKRYQSDKVGSREIQTYGSIPYQEPDVDTVIIVTSSSFSQPAQEVADDLNVKTINGDELYQIVRENSLSSIVATHLEVDDRSENATEIGTSNNTQSAQSGISNSASLPEENQRESTIQHTASTQTNGIGYPDILDDETIKKVSNVIVVLILAYFVVVLLSLLYIFL